MIKPRFHYGWVIVLVCFFCCFSYGLFYSFGVFFRHLQQEFGWSRALTSTVHSLHMVFFPVSALIIGWLTDKYGPRLPLIGGATRGSLVASAACAKACGSAGDRTGRPCARITPASADKNRDFVVEARWLA